jgi:hypothetical protein
VVCAASGMGLARLSAGDSRASRVDDTADLSASPYCLKSIHRGVSYSVYRPGGQITDVKPGGCM